MKKNLAILIGMLLLLSIANSGLTAPDQPNTPSPTGHALIPPIQARNQQQALGPQPGFYETSEYMIGSTAVGVVFIESNGAIDTDTETWTTTEENQVISEIGQALTWWAAQNTNAGISFTYDIHTQVACSYEPIIHPTGGTDNTYEKLWVSETLGNLGYTTGDWMDRTFSYNNALRTSKGTDWGFTVFVVDSSADADGLFSDGWSAYAYIGGPFVVMTYDNGLWGISRMDQVMAHETGHIFWATEEYNSLTEYSGYLGASDSDGSGGLMDTNTLFLSSGTQKQVGWQDTDTDSIHDIVDTEPTTTLDAYSPDPTRNTHITYYGNTTITPYPNNNPQPWATGNDVSINTITNTQYNVDGNYYVSATPVDGTFDSHTEAYSFTIPNIPLGLHTFTSRGINSVGNTDSTPASDTLTVIANQAPTNPTQPTGPSTGSVGFDYTFTTSSTDPENDDIRIGWDWNGDQIIDDLTDWNSSGAQISFTHNWTTPGTYMVSAIAVDNYSIAYSGWSTPHQIIIQHNQPPNTPNAPDGPTTGAISTNYMFTAGTTDPESDDIYYWFEWGDSTNSGWVGPYTSGVTASALHSWSSTGTYSVSVKAKDALDQETPFSPIHSITITSNQAPSTPSTPDGPTEGAIDTTYTFTTSSTDPESDDISYWFDWGDGTDSGWVGPYSSGATASATHSWSAGGIYQIKAKAKDANDVETSWSNNHAIYIDDNQAPNTPSRPDGETNGKKGTAYTYTTSSTDPDSDQLYYQWQWGDGSTSQWLGPYDSGEEASATYTWTAKGDYSIKVKCKDTNDLESDWSDPLPITMPRNSPPMPTNLILIFGNGVLVEHGVDDYVDIEITGTVYTYSPPLLFDTYQAGEFIRLYEPRGLFLPGLPLCIGKCSDIAIIG